MQGAVGSLVSLGDRPGGQPETDLDGLVGCHGFDRQGAGGGQFSCEKLHETGPWIDSRKAERVGGARAPVQRPGLAASISSRLAATSTASAQASSSAADAPRTRSRTASGTSPKRNAS